jgi:acylpyruvate hydrolase
MAIRSFILPGDPTPYTPTKLICVGRNFAAHAREMKSDVPESPVLFLKPPSAIITEGETVIRPNISRNVHHEVELTVLIGSTGARVNAAGALAHIAGYGIGLDMTLRDIQDEAKKRGLPWALPKGFDTSAPLSHFVLASQVRDPHQLRLELRVNGEIRQQGSTENFVFRLPELIAYASTFFTLERGDILFTGTPEGVGPVKEGDRMDCRLLNNDGSVLTSLHVNVR